MVDIVRHKGTDTASPLARFQDEMNDLFGRFFSSDWPFIHRGEAAAWWPVLDIAESEDTITVKAEVPSMKAEDIDISVHGQTLTISGEKKESEEQTKRDWYHVERRYGAFRRDIQLPSDVDVDRIEAECRDGVLMVKMPKTEHAKPKRIEVKP